MTVKVNKLELRTASEFRGLGSDLDDAMKKVINAEYGIYNIDAADKHLYLIIGNLITFQEQYNKGVRLIGSFGTRKVEIYNREEEQKILDDISFNMDL